MPELTATASRPVRVRRAVPDDLLGMAKVHVETWKGTYRGVVPDERLDALTVERDIAGGFGSWIAEPPPGVRQFVAVTPKDQVVGFAMASPNRESGDGYLGELGSIYVSKAHQGRGAGTELVRAVADHLVEQKMPSMIVWVLEDNPYRRFYEHLGGAFLRQRVGTSRLGGPNLREVSYGWKDVRALAHRAPPVPPA
jgi:ribosomal protein S18 acetylase RimI-like enzyme